MVLDGCFGLVFFTAPKALGELVSFSRIMLAFAFAPFQFVFWEILGYPRPELQVYRLPRLSSSAFVPNPPRLSRTHTCPLLVRLFLARSRFSLAELFDLSSSISVTPLLDVRSPTKENSWFRKALRSFSA